MPAVAQKIHAAIDRRPRFTVRDIVTATGVSDQMVRYHVDKLRARKAIRAVDSEPTDGAARIVWERVGS